MWQKVRDGPYRQASGYLPKDRQQASPKAEAYDQIECSYASAL
jgi:hypothetical protein